MRLNDTPTNEAILSNVSEVGEFRIRNSAKAFSILSSGLYANKIRAIIRELSCNAYDSHIEAGRGDVPFEVHLPTNLEPYFHVRDYGVGLSHDQVTNLYTTYFESTKSNSNDFIGALGLGSKSPFSYTENFTVTAVKNRRKGIYSAFINDAGVPSIALLSEELDVDDFAGVKVEFAVDTSDNYKFLQEAREVYLYFKTKPNINRSDFVHKVISYDERDIIPGVHSYANAGRGCTSVAVMGNISYPIAVPNESVVLGKDLAMILTCGLEMHFDIGELDIQASREGLSYIPQTINSIKKKLEDIVAVLDVALEAKLDAIDGVWEKAPTILRMKGQPLWAKSTMNWLKKSNYPLTTHGYSSSSFAINIRPDVVENAIDKPAVKQITTSSTRSWNPIKWKVNNDFELPAVVGVASNVIFIFNDTDKQKCMEKVKYNLSNGTITRDHNTIAYVFNYEGTECWNEKSIKEVLDSIHNPPANQVCYLSQLQDKPRKDLAERAKNVSLLDIEYFTGMKARQCKKYGYQWVNNGRKVGDKGEPSSTDKTYYYIPVSGYTLDSKYFKEQTIDTLMQYYTMLEPEAIPGKGSITVYGVRKSDIEAVRSNPKWKSFDDHAFDIFSKIKVDDLILRSQINPSTTAHFPLLEMFGRMAESVGGDFQFFSDLHNTITQINKDIPQNLTLDNYDFLYRKFNDDEVGKRVFWEKEAKKLKSDFDNKCIALMDKFPMLRHVSWHDRNNLTLFSNYVKMVERSV